MGKFKKHLVILRIDPCTGKNQDKLFKDLKSLGLSPEYEGADIMVKVLTRTKQVILNTYIIMKKKVFVVNQAYIQGICY